MNQKTIKPGSSDYRSLYFEVNRLRKRDGLEELGPLAFAQKVFSHFREERNPRVSEALNNLSAQPAKA